VSLGVVGEAGTAVDGRLRMLVWKNDVIPVDSLLGGGISLDGSPLFTDSAPRTCRSDTLVVALIGRSMG
jgi:hypothetical protein